MHFFFFLTHGAMASARGAPIRTTGGVQNHSSCHISPALGTPGQPHLPTPPLPTLNCSESGPITPPFPNNSAINSNVSSGQTSNTVHSFTWTTLPISKLTGDPYYVNAADPDHGIGNHCVCKNGATLSNIPWTGGSTGNISNCVLIFQLFLFEHSG